jgi:hypothetical protein
VENRTKRHEFPQSGLCEDLQCSKIAAPAKVKEIVSNQLSLVIEPDYSQQKMPGYQNQDQNQNQNQKTKIKIKFLIIKIEF